MILWYNNSFSVEDYCLCDIGILISLYGCYSTLFVSFGHFSKLDNRMLVSAEGHIVDILFFWSSFFCDNRILSATICWPDPKPSTTFVKFFPLWLTSNSDHWRGASKLRNFGSFKNHIISSWIQIILKGTLWYVLRFGPVEAILTFSVLLMIVVCLKDKLIKGDSSWTQVALTPIVLNQTSKVITREVKHTNAIKFALYGGNFLKAKESLVLPENKNCVHCLLNSVIACVIFQAYDFASHLVDFSVFNFQCFWVKLNVMDWRPVKIFFCKEYSVIYSTDNVFEGHFAWISQSPVAITVDWQSEYRVLILDN